MDFTKKLNLPSLDVHTFRITVLIVICILLYKYLATHFRKKRKMTKFAETIPGPPALPVVGNSLEFMCDVSNFGDKFIKYSKEYGPIYRLWIGNNLIICLTEPSDLEVVFRSSKVLGKPEIFQPFNDFWGNGIFTAPVHMWKRNRKVLQPAFSNKMIQEYVPEFNQKIYDMIHKMKEMVDGPVFDLWNYLPYLSFDIITKTAFDIELDSLEKATLQFHQYVKMAMENAFLRMFSPWVQIKIIYNLVFRRRIKLIRSSMLKYTEQIVHPQIEKLKKEINNHANDSLSSEELEMSMKPFLRATYKLKLMSQSEEQMYDEIMTMTGAATDTIALTNSFFLLSVAMHPDIQDKLYDELYEKFGDSDRPATYDDIANLPYLDQVLKETWRRFTIVPFIFRNVDEDIMIGSHKIPANTALMISIWDVHFSPKLYSDPLKFNPEHFAPEVVDKRHKLSFLPFSTGPRNCIGQSFAVVEIKLTLIALLRTFSFHTTVKMEDLKLNLSFLLTNRDGYRISIKWRDRRPSHIRK